MSSSSEICSSSFVLPELPGYPSLALKNAQILRLEFLSDRGEPVGTPIVPGQPRQLTFGALVSWQAGGLDFLYVAVPDLYDFVRLVRVGSAHSGRLHEQARIWLERPWRRRLREAVWFMLVRGDLDAMLLADRRHWLEKADLKFPSSWPGLDRIAQSEREQRRLILNCVIRSPETRIPPSFI